MQWVEQAAAAGLPMSLQHVKNIFVPFQRAANGMVSSALAYAASLATEANAHLTARLLGVKATLPYTVAPEFVGSLIETIDSKSEQELKDAHKAAEQLCGRENLVADLQSTLVSHDEALASVRLHGRLNDISVVDAPYNYYALGRSIVEELLFHTGRPVIVVPQGAATFRASRILVAWDGGERAARALHNAMPLLRAADRVEIVAVQNDKDPSVLPRGSELAPFLARHGVTVDVVALDMTDGAGKAILSRARTTAADLIVMGAFAHSRLRQFVMGGVTESMLTEAEVPVFMSH
jgi:nucleotide-binding universal stress UspA family protein